MVGVTNLQSIVASLLKLGWGRPVKLVNDALLKLLYRLLVLLLLSAAVLMHNLQVSHLAELRLWITYLGCSLH
jgi:hypothetical protein